MGRSFGLHPFHPVSFLLFPAWTMVLIETGLFSGIRLLRWCTVWPVVHSGINNKLLTVKPKTKSTLTIWVIQFYLICIYLNAFCTPLIQKNISLIYVGSQDHIGKHGRGRRIPRSFAGCQIQTFGPKGNQCELTITALVRGHRVTVSGWGASLDSQLFQF